MSQETVGLVVNGTLEVAPEDREKFEALVQENVGQTQGIPGCIFYSFAALDTHIHSKLMQAAFAEVGKLRTRFSALSRR